MSSAWFPFYFSDYAAKTEHLTLAEHGAYLLLMGSYYKRGCKLPANAEQLHRICRAFAPQEVEAVESVLGQFFEKKKDGYYHKRIEEEIKKQKEISKKRSDAAKKRHANAGTSADANAEFLHGDLHTQSQSQSQPHPKPLPTKGVAGW